MCTENPLGDAKGDGTDGSLFSRLDSFESKEHRKGKGYRWVRHYNRKTLSGESLPVTAGPESKGRQYKPKEIEDRRHVDMSEALEPAEADFFHSGSAVRRRRVATALMTAGSSPAVVSRFNNCGSRAWVHRNKKTGDVRVSADFCRNRFCERCSARVGRRARGAIEQLTEGKEIRLITLTLSHVRSDKLAVLLARLLAAFKALRRVDSWDDHVRGGAYVLETKYNRTGGGWHPHLHIVADCDFIPVKQMRRDWRRLVGKGNIDVQHIRSKSGIARYVAKYVTKQFEGSVFHDADRLAEAVCAFRGTRAMGTFGDWRGVEIVGETEAFDKDDWKPLCRLTDLLALVERGCSSSARILALLTGRKPPPVSGDTIAGFP